MRRTYRLFVLLAVALAATMFAPTFAMADASGVLTLKQAVRQPWGDSAQVPHPAEKVSLPDAWNRSSRQGRWQYDMSFELASAPQQPWGLFIPRSGNRLTVLVNDTPVEDFGRMGNAADDHAQHPLFSTIRVGALLAGHNTLRVRVEGDRARYAGLSTVRLGPYHEIRRAYQWRNALQTGGSLAVVVTCGLFGLLALLIAIKSRSREFALFAAANAFFATRATYALVETVPFDFRAWAWLMDICYAGCAITIALYCAQALNLPRKLVRPATAVFALSSLLLITAQTMLQRSDLRQAWTLMMLVYVTGMCALVIHAWGQQRSPASAALAIAASIGIAMGVHDHILVFYTADGYGGFAIARFALMFFIVAMGWILADALRNRMQQDKLLRAALAAELDANKAQLAAEFARREQLTTQQAQGVERQRLMQDLHDGLGLQLNGLLGLVERAQPDTNAIRSEVHTTLEQLRLLVDSSESFEGTLTELLGHIRHRLASHLSRHGIRLEWALQPVEADFSVLPGPALHLQRLMFEMCSNVIKHAGATCVTVIAERGGAVTPSAFLRLAFSDNGLGFPAAAAPAGFGLTSMRRRLADLNATWEREACQPTGARYTLTVPLASLRADAASPSP